MSGSVKAHSCLSLVFFYIGFPLFVCFYCKNTNNSSESKFYNYCASRITLK